MDNDDPKKGRKFDSGKPRMSLLPPYALEEVAKVLTVGAQKYAADNWKYVEDGETRYKDAMFRHINSYNKGEIIDPETGLHHLAHAMCCAMFIVDAYASKVPLAPKKTNILSGTVWDTIKVPQDPMRQTFGGPAQAYGTEVRHEPYELP